MYLSVSSVRLPVQRLAQALPAAAAAAHRTVFMHAVRLRNEGIGSPRLQHATVPSGLTFGVELETFMPS